MNKKEISGLVLILFGISLLFIRPIFSITGMAIADNFSDLSSFLPSILGIVLIVGGVIIWAQVREISDILDVGAADFERMVPTKRKGKPADESAKHAIRYVTGVNPSRTSFESCIMETVDILQGGYSTRGRAALNQIKTLSRKIHDKYPAIPANKIYYELSKEMHGE